MQRSKKLRKQKSARLRKCFQQKQLHGLASLLEYMREEERMGLRISEMGSSSISDSQAHVARVKKAMGIQPSVMDIAWAAAGDTDASLYVGFAPGIERRGKKTRIDPIEWLCVFADALPRMPIESARFVDEFIASMVRISIECRNRVPGSFDSFGEPLCLDQIDPQKHASFH